MATYIAIARTYSYLTPDLWFENMLVKPPYKEFSDYLSEHHTIGGKPVGAAPTPAAAV